MSVLTYHSAKRQIVFMALYFLITGIVIRVIGYSLQGSLSAFSPASMGSLLSGKIALKDVFDLSQFDGFSLNMWLVFLKEQIKSLLDELIPTTLGVANILMLGKYLTMENAIKLGIKLY